MKGIVLLLLTLQGYAEVINNCGEDKRFRVIKSNGNYTLELCISRDNCMELINFISRTNEQTCDYCRGITDGSDQDSNNKTTCEAHLDSFFSDYCENAAFDQCTTSSPSTQQPITPTACTNVITEVVSRVTTKVITERVSVVYTSNNEKPTNNSELNSQLASTRAPLAAIGVLTGILLVILALVTTGWMWTCWTMNKTARDRAKITTSETNDLYLDNNPAYETTAKLHSSTNNQVPLNVNPAYEVTKRQLQDQLEQDASKQGYEVITTTSRLQKR